MNKTRRKRWHVVAESRFVGKDDRVWTLSRNKEKAGWKTDAGCNGYGLTFAEATELADAANERAASHSKCDHHPDHHPQEEGQQ